jgi:hypothetical protein
MRRLRSFAALFVAIGSIFLTTPAHADTLHDWSLSYNTAYDANTDCVVFSYTWGSASKSYPVNADIQGIQFNINVENDTTNKIGWGGEVFDSYSIQMDLINAGVVVDTVNYSEDHTKHVMQPRQIGIGYTGHVDSANITLSGIDNGYWGGYYGPIMCSPWIDVLGTTQPTSSSTPEPPQSPTPEASASPEPSTTPTIEPSPTSTPQDTPSPTATATPTPTVPSNSISGDANEGWDLTLTAPEGYVFDSVYFASYGVPENYTTQWCDASTSVQKVAEVFIGQTTGTIASNNAIFGDPCGGTYKHLQVTLTYKPIVPIVVPTPVPPVTPDPTPSPTPTPEPVVPIPDPQPSKTEEPVAPTPTPQPTVEPSPSPTREPTPAPTQTTQPVIVPTPNVPSPTPTPEPSKTPEPVALITHIASVDPASLSKEEVVALVSAANSVLAVADQGSPVYEQALQALAVAAVADDPQLPPALEAVPGAAQVLATFNALGNVGADMAPQVRQAAKKTVIASVIGVQAAVSAVGAATTVTASSTTTVRKK